jgi:hypothetical protein
MCGVSVLTLIFRVSARSPSPSPRLLCCLFLFGFWGSAERDIEPLALEPSAPLLVFPGRSPPPLFVCLSVVFFFLCWQTDDGGREKGGFGKELGITHDTQRDIRAEGGGSIVRKNESEPSRPKTLAPRTHTHTEINLFARTCVVCCVFGWRRSALCVFPFAIEPRPPSVRARCGRRCAEKGMSDADSNTRCR